MKTFTFIAALTMLLIAPAVSAQGKVSRPPLTKERVIERLLENMVYVEGGSFMMGSDEYTSPVHKETVNPFHIGRYEVTQREWEVVMGNNPSYFKGDDLPVENVSWNECINFIKRLNNMTGKNFRLPTEAEWEYAAKGGKNSHEYKYSGSNNIYEVAWYQGSSSRATHKVGRVTANELGLYDMSGNVWEWCKDKIKDKYSSSGNSYRRVVRGGSWNSYGDDCRVIARNAFSPDDRYRIVGFRLAL